MTTETATWKCRNCESHRLVEDHCDVVRDRHLITYQCRNCDALTAFEVPATICHHASRRPTHTSKERTHGN